MDHFDRYLPTGRTCPTPDGRLVEVQDPESGHLLAAVVIDAHWRDHAALVDRIVPVRGFLESPMVTGLGELDLWDPDQGAFVYPTGLVWSAAEVFEQVARQGRVPGVRAALELVYVGALVLLDAARIAQPQGLYAHGDVNPWRIVLQPDGEVLVLGYGVPPVPALRFVESASEPPPDALLRYAPPERLDDRWEDWTSDLFSLVLIGVEWMTGEALYPAQGRDLLAAAKRGTARDRLWELRDVLPRPVVDGLVKALAPYPDSRFADGEEVLDTVRGLLDSPLVEGPGLAAWMAEIAGHFRRARPLPSEEPAEASPAPSDDAPDPPTPRDRMAERWTRPARRDDDTEAARRESVLSLRESRMERHHESARRGRNLRAPRDRNAMFPRRPLRESERYLVHVDGGPGRWARLDPTDSLAESAARLVDQLVPTPLGPDGMLEGWYRIWQGDAAWYGDAKTAVLDPEQPLDLRWIENELLPALVRVEEDDAVELEVGTAVHAQFLISAFRRRLGLSRHRYDLQVEGRSLDAWQVLDDFEPAPGLALRLIRSSASQSSGLWRARNRAPGTGRGS